MSMVRMSSRPASAMLSEPVKVSTMINPKSTSAMRSTGLEHAPGGPGLFPSYGGAELTVGSGKLIQEDRGQLVEGCKT